MTRKPIIYTADAVRVDSDEQGFGLVIDTDEGDKLYINIHRCALDFYDSVRVEMRGWVAEADMARAAVNAGVSLEEYTSPQPVTNRPVDVYEAIGAGYALDDPKSPGYHDRMSDISDTGDLF
jgi:hypothetical protein